MKTPADLLSSEMNAREQAYAPYSGFKVGASLRGSGGEMFSGCNVENASSELTICAECATVFPSVTAGIRTFIQMIVADSVALCPPCGACRQALFEFASSLEIWAVNLLGEMKFYRLCDLLSEAFGVDFIPRSNLKQRS